MRILQLIGAILVLIATPAMAKADPAAWTVMQKSGDVRVLRNGLQPASVQVRDALAPGDVVATGANGRAMLTRGEDYVVVAPGSRLLLPKEQQQSGFTRLIQQVGTMLYKVKHTGVPHFAVETPMLAAVVKGTSFTVVVDKDRAAVQVTEGVVEVSSAEGSARRLVERGVTVYVGRERPQQIIEMKPGAADLPSSSSDGGETVKIDGSGDVPLSTITDLTGGLIREVPAAPVVAVANTPTVSVTTVQPVTPVADTATPVVAVAEVGTPAVATPAAVTPATVTPGTTTPAVVTPAVVAPGATTPVVTTPAVATPAVTTPAVVTPAVVTPAVVTPAVTVPAVVTPVATVPAITAPAVTVPTVTVPVPVATVPIATPIVTTPTVTTPTVTTPTITTPVVTTPVIATPIVTVPAVTVPVVTVPTVTVPTVTLPPVTLPTIGIGLPKGP